MSRDATPLSELLRTGTRPQHEHAETRSFVTQLMNGELGREAYIDLAVQHHAIYTALEGVGERLQDDEIASAFVLPELLRVPSLEADLAVLIGPAWRETAQILPATAAYVARLEAIDSPAGYLAHAYTRYLGDLSGGQAIAVMLQRHYGMTPDELSFYRFTEIPKPKPFKDRFRALMDAAAFSAQEREAAVAEATVAFELNAALFVELGAAHAPSDSSAA